MQVPLIKVTLEPKAYLKGDFGHAGLGAFTLEETVPTGSTLMELLHRLAGNYRSSVRKHLPWRAR